MGERSLMKTWRIPAWKKALKVSTKTLLDFLVCLLVFVLMAIVVLFLLLIDKPGAKGGDVKNAKKASVSKPNSIKSMFMNSNVKKPAEVSDHMTAYFIVHVRTCNVVIIVNYIDVCMAEKCGPLQR